MKKRILAMLLAVFYPDGRRHGPSRVTIMMAMKTIPASHRLGVPEVERTGGEKSNATWSSAVPLSQLRHQG
jgi:hypothetical protein